VCPEYNLHEYGRMVRDRVRMDAYTLVLERSVRPTSVVLDIGAGIGTFSLLAARFGARRVFALESGDVIELGRMLAAVNGVADRIEFIQADSTSVELPERADVIVSDLHGVLPQHRAHIPSIIDARQRHLAPRGKLIPFRDTLWAAPLELPSEYEKIVAAWESPLDGLDLSVAREHVANGWWRVLAPLEALLAEPERVAVLDYRAIESPDLKLSTEFEATRSRTLHGFGVWFGCELADGVGFSNAPPLEPGRIYGQAFFPLTEPVDLSPGDEISFDLSANLIGGEYLFRWDTRIAARSDPERAKASFSQSTLFARPLSPHSLAGLQDDHMPALTEQGQAVAYVLAHTDGQRAIRELSQDIVAMFPDLFRSASEAVSFVTEVTRKYCR
jgi:protein arginine N-methyltransferase 1